MYCIAPVVPAGNGKVLPGKWSLRVRQGRGLVAALGLRTRLKCRNMQPSQPRFNMCAVPMARRMSHRDFLALLPMPERILYHPGMSLSSLTYYNALRGQLRFQEAARISLALALAGSER